MPGVVRRRYLYGLCEGNRVKVDVVRTMDLLVGACVHGLLVSLSNFFSLVRVLRNTTKLCEEVGYLSTAGSIAVRPPVFF